MALHLEREKLTVFDNAAAGHEGVLTDESGAVVVKPCTPAELAFYEETYRQHPDFAELVPTFLGTLELGTTQQIEDALAAAKPSSPNQTIVLPPAHDVHRRTTSIELASHANIALRGKAIKTDTAIVLSNIAHGFVKPNILDIKLGKQLWDEEANIAKRQRLDQVSAETTSGPLGFRVAGMKVWKGNRYANFDKIYGRNRTVQNVHEAFKELFDVADDDDGDRTCFADVYYGAVEAVEEIERAISSQESRMYSSSLLFVYEGDRASRRAALQAVKEVQGIERPSSSLRDSGMAASKEAEGEDSDDSEADEPKLFDVRVIDFAHAKWTPGAGPDENMLHGIRSVIKVLKGLA